jgi:hypothetical protein
MIGALIGPIRHFRTMNANHLGTYGNDYLAGSVAAVESLDHLLSANAGTPRGRLFT